MMANLSGHVALLRGLLVLETDPSVLESAIVNAIEDIIESLDGLRGRFGDDPPDPPPDGFGAI